MSTLPPIALQLYTVRDQLAVDWQDTLEKIAAMGYAGVETAGFAYAPAAAVKAKLDALGLAVAAAHSPLPQGPQGEQALADLRALGCDRLVLGGTGRERYQTEEGIRAEAAAFNQAAVSAAAAGIRFGVHNHWWEFGRLTDGRLAFDSLVEAVDPAVFFEIDTYWVRTAGEDPQAVIARLGERAPLLHIKDGPATVEDAMVAVGQGTLPFETIIPAGRHAEWLIVELDRCDGDMLAAVRDSIDFLVAQGLGRGR